MRGYPVNVVIDCIMCASEKENQIPRLITMILKNVDLSKFNLKGSTDQPKGTMRKAEDIANDYDIDMSKIGL